MNVKPHVLRFWESKFDEIQPVEACAAGRRFYRPEDVALIAGIKHLLHEQGMTIKGVQKHLKTMASIDVRALASGEKQKTGGLCPASGLNRRTKPEAARQNLLHARILLTGEDS